MEDIVLIIIIMGNLFCPLRKIREYKMARMEHVVNDHIVRRRVAFAIKLYTEMISENMGNLLCPRETPRKEIMKYRDIPVDDRTMRIRVASALVLYTQMIYSTTEELTALMTAKKEWLGHLLYSNWNILILEDNTEAKEVYRTALIEELEKGLYTRIEHFETIVKTMEGLFPHQETIKSITAQAELRRRTGSCR